MLPTGDREMHHATKRQGARRFMTASGTIVISACLTAMTGWSILAIYYSNLPPKLRPVMAGVFGVTGLVLSIRGGSNRRARRIFLASFVVVLVWWLTIPPSDNRDWQPDVALLPSAEITGDRVTIHNIRNCDYRNQVDYTCLYYNKTFDLNRLRTADLFLIYWGSPLIAHTMLSFGFEGQGQICFSVETRKEKGEEYSAIKGFFKQYELTYIVADERDLVRLRTNYRKEDVYLYRLKADPGLIRKVFLDYLRQVNRINVHPEWYNALTSNCTTNIRAHTAPFTPNRFDWRIIVNGYVDRMLYERGVVDRSMPFEELKRKSYINPRAQEVDRAPDFSRRIRNGLPGMGP